MTSKKNLSPHLRPSSFRCLLAFFVTLSLMSAGRTPLAQIDPRSQTSAKGGGITGSAEILGSNNLVMGINAAPNLMAGSGNFVIGDYLGNDIVGQNCQIRVGHLKLTSAYDNFSVAEFWGAMGRVNRFCHYPPGKLLDALKSLTFSSTAPISWLTGPYFERFGLRYYRDAYPETECFDNFTCFVQGDDHADDIYFPSTELNWI